MILEPDSLTLAGIVGLLTAVLWLTPLRATVFSAPARPRTRPPHLLQSRRGNAAPVRLAPVSAGAGAPVAPLATAFTAGDALPSAHMVRVGEILASAIDSAQRAQRLHRSAHEQLDSAHYALQNLLHELSAVMPIAAPAQPQRDVRLLQARTLRPVYETALAA